jgi:3'(2'), 5'-bisphosphate nucleotidase
VQHKLSSEGVLTKGDKSPVTVADFSAQAIINTHLRRAFPDTKVVGEEAGKDLQGETGAVLRRQVAALTGYNEDDVVTAVDFGGYRPVPGVITKGDMWALDPLDGTKGFLRGEQYAVALGLIVDGKVKLGVLGCPNLPVDWSKPDGEKGVLFVGEVGGAAFMAPLATMQKQRIHVSGLMSGEDGAKAIESVETGHSAHSEAEEVARLLGLQSSPARMDSQCKYAALARGESEIYMRLPTSQAYQEKIWDHAAGVAVIEAAGGKVSDVAGQELDFTRGYTLKNNKGVIATNKHMHEQVVAAVQKVLGTYV